MFLCKVVMETFTSTSSSGLHFLVSVSLHQVLWWKRRSFQLLTRWSSTPSKPSTKRNNKRKRSQDRGNKTRSPRKQSTGVHSLMYFRSHFLSKQDSRNLFKETKSDYRVYLFSSLQPWCWYFCREDSHQPFQVNWEERVTQQDANSCSWPTVSSKEKVRAFSHASNISQCPQSVRFSSEFFTDHLYTFFEVYIDPYSYFINSRIFR